MQNKSQLPQSKEAMLAFTEEVFGPVKDRLCVTTMFSPGGGKRIMINSLIKEKTVLAEFFGDDYAKKLFIYVNPDEILGLDSADYLNLMLENLTEVMRSRGLDVIASRTTNPLVILKKNISYLVSQDWHVVFLLHDFEFTLELPKTIFRNLESILGIKKTHVSFVFLVSKNILAEEVLSKFHNFKYAINRVVRYYKLLSPEVEKYLIDVFSKKLNISISSEVKKVISNLCGGHPQLVKYSLYVLNDAGPEYLTDKKKANDHLEKYSQFDSISHDIWSHLNKTEKESLLNLVKTGSFEEGEDSYLVGTGIVKKKGEQYLIFGELFKNFIEGKLPKSLLSYNKKTSEIFFESKPCGANFTPQEFNLMKFFLDNEGNIISRDDVGTVLWGKKADEKYSDWHIDKVISTLRKKLDSIGFSSKKLSTLKGRGYRFSN